MKRILLAGAALVGVLGVASAQPARAGSSTAESASLVSAIANPVLGLVPAPEGWKQRSICVGNEQMDKAWCLYFPWPN
jgi:hypothetical protein